jgi:cytochrome c-type biogenesis protein CcmH/NrfF
MRGRAAALALTALLAGATAAVGASQQEIEEALTCQCGCGLTVHACNHLECPSGKPMKQEIAERLARGEDEATILAAFRARYGEKVLSSPTFNGFNRFAWITPFAAVLAAAGFLLVLLARRSRRTTAAPAAVVPVANAELRGRLERELARHDEQS